VNSLDNQGGCVCPLCGEYEGEPASVEAHISSRVDDAHRGSVGEHYRDEIAASGGGDPVATTSHGASPGAVVEADPEAASGYESSPEGVAEPGETSAYEGVDVEPGRALLVGTVLFAVVVGWYALRGDDQPDDEADDLDDEQPESELIGTAEVPA
jgi:hypothetical protein